MNDRKLLERTFGLMLVVLVLGGLILTACGETEVEVTRVVKETVIERVEVAPVFDAEAEKQAVVAVSVGLNEDTANGDREAALAALHEDLTGFASFPEHYAAWAYQDVGWTTEGETARWDDYEVLVSPDLAVIKGNSTLEIPGFGPVPTFATVVFKKEDGQWKLIHMHLSYAGT